MPEWGFATPSLLLRLFRLRLLGERSCATSRRHPRNLNDASSASPRSAVKKSQIQLANDVEDFVQDLFGAPSLCRFGIASNSLQFLLQIGPPLAEGGFESGVVQRCEHRLVDCPNEF